MNYESNWHQFVCCLAATTPKSDRRRLILLPRGKKNRLPRKEVIHPQLPLRMPCYDFVPVTSLALVPIMWAFGHYQLPWRDGRWVQDPRTYSPWHSWSTITSDSSFMEANCSLQSELRKVFRDWLQLALWLPSVPPIVARVLPKA